MGEQKSNSHFTNVVVDNVCRRRVDATCAATIYQFLITLNNPQLHYVLCKNDRSVCLCVCVCVIHLTRTVAEVQVL